MVKPVDGRSGIGMTVCYEEKQLKNAIDVALEHSRSKRFIVERYMQCDDMGMYYTFKDGECSASCIYDRYTTDEQPGLSRVCLGGTYDLHSYAYVQNISKLILNVCIGMQVKCFEKLE